MKRCICGEIINSKRAEIGYSTCLECGEESARQIAKDRNRSVMPLNNKGAYGLITGQTIQDKLANIIGLTKKGIHE